MFGDKRDRRREYRPKPHPPIHEEDTRRVDIHGGDNSVITHVDFLGRDAFHTPPSPVQYTSPPDISEPHRLAKATIMAALVESVDFAAVSRMNQKKAREEILSIVAEIILIKNLRLSTSEQAQIVIEICDELFGFGPLESLLARQDIGDIMVNGANNVFIEVAGRIEKTDITFRDDQHLQDICQRMASKVGRHVDSRSPVCDARLEDGSRVNVILPPLAIHGPALTIRKFKRDRLRLRDLVNYGSISAAGARLLAIISACQCNVLISGGTGSGKTTLLNCMTAFIDDAERIVTLEDAAELQLQQPHVVSLETRPPNIEGIGEIGMTALMKNALRMRPERIIVGEVRGPEAMDLLQAMNTGHDGSMGTIHANSPREAISRIEALITMGGNSLPIGTLRQMITASIDIIVQTSRLRDGSRRITHITEVIGMNGDIILTQDLLTFDIDETQTGKTVQGYFRSSGISRPKFWNRAVYFDLDERLTAALEEAGAPQYRPQGKASELGA